MSRTPSCRAPAGGRVRRRLGAITAVSLCSVTVAIGATLDDPIAASPGPPPTEPSPGPTGTPPTTAPPTTAPEPPPTTGAPGPPTTAPATTAPPATARPRPPRRPGTPTTTTASRPAPLGQLVVDGQLAHILATIRYMESRGIYTLPPNRGNASGAYQYIKSTWDGYRGYAHAYLAPPAVQDERAALDVSRFLAEWSNDVSMIPVLWYYPIAARRPALMDVVPVPGAGNVLTVREYQTRWLAAFATISGRPVTPVGVAVDLAPVPGSPPEVPDRPDGLPSLSFPVLGPAQVAVPDCDGAQTTDGVAARGDLVGAGLCTPEAPAVVLGRKLQPVLAVVVGVVTEVVDRPGTATPISVTVTNTAGRSVVYSGFNDDSPGTDDGAAARHLRLSPLARLGATVRAGQVLGYMGDTDALPDGVAVPAGSADGADGADAAAGGSGVPERPPDAGHIRLEVFDLDGRALDTYGPVLDALYRQTCSLGTGPWSGPAADTGAPPVTVEVADVHDDVDSEWIITDTGQLLAAGWAAMINPQETCTSVPAEHYGPGAAGPAATPNSWLVPLELPTTIWVQVARQSLDTAPTTFVRRG